MAQFVSPTAPIVSLMVLSAVRCSPEALREAAPRPEIGVVRTEDRSCTGTRIHRGEVLTAASCLAGARAHELLFEPLDGGEASSVNWVSHGMDPNSNRLDDWAILSLADTADGEDIAARHLGPAGADEPEPATRLWWAAASATSNRVDTGFCKVLRNQSLPTVFDFSVVEHDCDLADVSPGVLLYRLQDDAPRAVAFQGRGRDAILVDSFSDVPVPIADAFANAETFLSVPVSKVYALDAQGRLNTRLGLDGDWSQWAQLDDGDEEFVKLDDASEPRDFAYDALTHLWALDRAGALHGYDLTTAKWGKDASTERFIDVSTSRASGQVPRLFALTAEGRLCTRPDSRPVTAEWSCAELGSSGVHLDAAPITDGHIVLVVLPNELLTVRYIDDVWQEPVSIAEEGAYRVATIASTETGVPYVVAQRTDRLRIRVGDRAAQSWLPWSPLYGPSNLGVVSGLDAGHIPGHPEVLYAVVDGEIVTSSETPEASIDRWSSDATEPPEFGEWRRIESLVR